jgi:hypothetical protein
MFYRAVIKVVMDLPSSVHQSAFCKMSNPRLSFGVEHQLVGELWVLYLVDHWSESYSF